MVIDYKRANGFCINFIFERFSLPFRQRSAADFPPRPRVLHLI
jgi:hypothetical protein